MLFLCCYGLCVCLFVCLFVCLLVCFFVFVFFVLLSFKLLRLSGSDRQEAPPGSMGSALLSVSNNGAGSGGTRDPVSLLKCSPLGTLCTSLHWKMKPVPEQQEVCPFKSLRRVKFRAQSLFTVRFICFCCSGQTLRLAKLAFVS